MNISFDFDDTLFFVGGIKNIPLIVRLCESVKAGHNVIVVTRRNAHSYYHGMHSAQCVMLLQKHCMNVPITYTNGENKWRILEELNIHEHYDDAIYELEEAKANTSIKLWQVNPYNSKPSYNRFR